MMSQTFTYHDGQRKRQGDPLELARRLADAGVLDLDALMAAKGTATAFAEVGRIIDAIRDVFGIAPLDAGGLGDLECLVLIGHFAKHAARIAKQLIRPE